MISTKVKATLLSVVMTVMMVGGHVSAAVVPKDNIDPSKATVIKADQEVTVTVDGTKDEIDLYKFVPEQSGKYRIIAKKIEGKNFNPSAYFYKSDMFVLDGFSSINSSLLDITYNGYTVFLTKGETYYIQAKSGNYQVTSDYKMSLVYASADTSTKTGWIELQNKWYYFDDTGLMARGWEQAGSYWYYFGADHSMTTGWLSEKNVWYYLDKNNGKMTDLIVYKKEEDKSPEGQKIKIENEKNIEFIMTNFRNIIFSKISIYIFIC